jgi:hypothetical protein
MKPYRPSHSIEWDRFQSAYCNCCHYDGDPEQDKGCKVLARSMVYRITEPEYPKEWQQNEKGEPTCTKYSTHEQWRLEHPYKPKIAKNQMKLF